MGVRIPLTPLSDYMEDCIFCKIVKGEIPSYNIYKDENFLAFLDINPRNQGHSIVIPKKHYRWVWDIENVGQYFEVVRKVAKSLQKALGTEWVISVIIGDEVAHAHIQLIPRFKNDGHGSWLDLRNIKKISKEEMEKIAEKIRNSFDYKALK
jgi:histidine triad (HIT) family protein